MIFSLSERFIDSVPPSQLSDLVSEIVRHEHYISVSGTASQKLMAAVEDNASTSQKELLRVYNGFSPSVDIQTYCTTVSDAAFPYDALLEMAKEPAVVLMENTREWVVYKKMIECYADDTDYGNLFKMLKRAADKPELLKPVKSGGCGEMLQSLTDFMTTGYAHALEEKVYLVFDRDTTSAGSFDSNKKRLFIRLTGKKFNKLSNADVYSLSQPGFVWHMWYRRELENYFPDSVFLRCKFKRKAGMPPFEKDHYADVKDYYAPNKQAEKRLKNAFPALSAQMDKALFEQDQQVFPIDGKSLGEIKLFLLKMIKVV